MTARLGVREITRNFSILEDYDYVEIEDKKTHNLKGLFVSNKYAQEFKKFIDAQITKEHQEKLDRVMQYVGKLGINEQFDNLSSTQIKQKIALDKHEEK